MSFLSQYFSNLIMDEGRKTGKVCLKWPDQDIIDELKKLDKEFKGNRYQEYWDTCHTPEFVYRPNSEHFEESVSIICKCNDVSRAEFCDYKNDEVAKSIKKMFIKTFN